MTPRHDKPRRYVTGMRKLRLAGACLVWAAVLAFGVAAFAQDPQDPPDGQDDLQQAMLEELLQQAASQASTTEPSATPPAAAAQRSAPTPTPPAEPPVAGPAEPPAAPAEGPAQPTTGPATAESVATAPAATEPAATLPAATRPAMSRPFEPGAPVALNFKDAPLRTVLEYLSEAAGMIVVADVPVEGRVTVVSRQQIPVSEAIGLLDTVLKQKGYAAVRLGRTLKIVTIEQAKKELLPVRSGSDPEKIEPSDRMVTQIIPIRSVDATRLRADLASLIPSSADVTSNASSNTLIVTGTEATVRKLVEIIHAIDGDMSAKTEVKVFQLQYANASSAARLITEVFREDQTQQRGGGITIGRREFVVPGMPGGPGGQGSEQAAGQRGSRVTASADDRTNTLVVSAAPDLLKVIEGVVKELDANPATESAVFIYHLRNAQAVNLESVLNNIFGAATAGRTTAGTTGRTTGTTGRTTGAGGRTTGGTTGGFGTRAGGISTRGLGGSAIGMQGAGGAGGTQGRAAGATGTRTGTGAFGAMARGLSPTAAAAASDLAGQVYVVANTDTNSLLVTTASKNFERVQAIIAELDRAVPQVLIKVLIAEVSHEDSLDLGTELAGMYLRPSGMGFKVGTDFSVAAETGGFTFKLDERYVDAAIRAIAGVGKLDVLSRPYILTSDNQAASIMVGQTVPYPTDTRTTDTGQTISSITYADVGIILEVTPHINPQGLVTLDVYPEISTLTDSTVQISETFKAPVFNKRFAQSRVAIRDGQTIVIGGLMEDRKTKTLTKVPVLGDIPGLGLLFQRNIDKKTKTELLIFLTPHVAKEPEDLQGMSEDEKAGTKIVPEAVEKGAFQEHLEGLKRGAASRPASLPAAWIWEGDRSTSQPATEPDDEKNP